MIQLDQPFVALRLPSADQRAPLRLERLLTIPMAWLDKIVAPQTQTMPHPLNPGTFREFVAGNRHAVIHFWTPGNERDGLMNQFLASRVSARLRQEIAFASFNVDVPGHNELVRQHKAFDVPLLAFYRDGALVRTETGSCGPGIMLKRLRELAGCKAAG
jgi:hypothetical protein